VVDLSQYVFEALRKDDKFILYRGRSKDDGSKVLVVSPVTEYPAPEILKWQEHAYSLREELDPAWAARPIAIARHWDRTVLVLEDPGGEPLDQLLGQPLELGLFVRLAIGLSRAVGQLHQSGIIHKDIKPGNVLVNSVTGQCWLRGFGFASRFPSERQAAEAPEFIAGTLAYMAPEQTGRMNRSIDSRSDLYSLGVTFYEMLTGSLPFNASDSMEWVHCHIARQPVSPGERRRDVPAPVSAIIMKLLAKTAEERYQTAAGVESDLRHCLDEYSRSSGVTGVQEKIPEFSLGEHDAPDQLLIPEKLYGRAQEVEALLASFDRIVKSGRPELVLVSGYSGIGKSSVVNELHKALVPPRGLFASGKFDQYKRDIPYATLAQAFQSLIRRLLGKSDAELSNWRDALLKALDPSGSLIVDLVPELKLIIGEQPPVPELPPQDAQHRFQLVFRRFIGVFARPEHPLALFLDDLQWLDAATLDLLEDLLRQPDVQHLMLIGAYRDNEVNSAHPLMRKLEAIRQAGAKVREIILAPLTYEDLGRLIADSLHCEPKDITLLAQLVHGKTAGNAFFVIQFISALADEGLLAFDHGAGRWAWDLDRIHAKGYTDNVVDLMVGKLNRLPPETQKALQEFACLGNSAEITTLAVVHGTSEEDVHSDLWEALRLGFIVYLERSYKFVHDRVQEAAYSLVPEPLRDAAHLRIGRLLAAHTSPEKRDEAIFEIVNQLNRGAALITLQKEREQLAELNLIAGMRAKASTAYASALKYLSAGAELLAGSHGPDLGPVARDGSQIANRESHFLLLTSEAWERRHKLAFNLELQRAECEFLTGELAIADQRLMMLSSRAANTVEQSTVTCLRADLYLTLDQSDRAVAVCLDYLRHLGIEWAPHPTAEEAGREYQQIWKNLGGREIEELMELPLMSEPESLATLDVLTKVSTPAMYTDANLLSLALCRAVNLSLEHGNSDGSCHAYGYLGMLAGPHFGNYQAGFRFGRLGYELVEKRGLKRFQARTYAGFGLVIPWTKHILAGRDLPRRAFEAANKIGDLNFAVYSCSHLNTNMLAAGDPLLEVQREAEHGLEFAQKMRFGLVIDRITLQLGLIRTLRGLTPKFGSFDDEHFDEPRFERHLSSNPALAIAECFYWVRKLQARFFAGDFESAIEAANNAQRLVWTSPSFFEMAEYHFYAALSHAACCGSALPDQDAPTSSPLEALAKSEVRLSRTNEEHFEALVAHHRQLEIWAENCPENFENRAALVGAEIARIEDRELDAQRLYERAIRSAQTNGFVHNEALANELAARFYAARGFEKIAHAYLRDARYGYLRWGADGKVRQLDELYPYLQEEERVPGPTNTIGASAERLDLATICKVSQAVSGEIILEKLIETIMRAAIEHAGAERGLLIFPQGTEQRIEAEAATCGETIVVHLREAPTRNASAAADSGGSVPEAAVPESIIHYVARTQENVVLDNASSQSAFSEDPYIRGRQVRSVLCLPLINQSKFIGVLYLENNLTSRAFTPKRIAVLKLLASQAAISLENTRLYRHLEQREAKIRRLVDTNIVGIFIWDIEGKIIEANDAFLHMLGFSREDLIAGRLCWNDLTPAEWREISDRALSELNATGTFQPLEKEYFRKDGSRVSVMRGGGLFEGSRNEGVAFVLDLSEQKRAEEALQKAQAELAHVTRVTTLGELTTSIAHEINQPLAAAGSNASACLRWLAARNLEEAQDSAALVIADVERAGQIIGRIRALAKKTPPQKDWLDLNETIRDVIAMVRNTVQRNQVLLQTWLPTDLPMILADRVQLQQVILNLLINAIEALSGVVDGPRELRISSQRVREIPNQSEKDRFEDRAAAQSGWTHVLVAVEDSGPGLDPRSLDRLFDAFHTTKPQGLGMGLAISRSIIEAHGGRLWAMANASRGAVFQFTLPIFAEASAQ
jgi:PAS domain S-box-containing protein